MLLGAVVATHVHKHVGQDRVLVCCPNWLSLLIWHLQCNHCKMRNQPDNISCHQKACLRKPCPQPSLICPPLDQSMGQGQGISYLKDAGQHRRVATVEEGCPHAVGLGRLLGWGSGAAPVENSVQASDVV